MVWGRAMANFFRAVTFHREGRGEGWEDSETRKTVHGKAVLCFRQEIVHGLTGQLTEVGLLKTRGCEARELRKSFWAPI